MSRQREWQKKQVEEGRCQICGSPEYRKVYCKKHYLLHIERMRKYYRKKREEELRKKNESGSK